MKLQEELKLCPFCGGQANIISGRRNDDDWGRFWVNYHRPYCQKCGVTFGEFDKKKDAITAWNTRTAGA